MAFPKITEQHVDQKSNPINNATHVPVQTPVKGIGIATNMKIASIFFQYSLLNLLLFSSEFSIDDDFFFILFSRPCANFPNSLVFLSQLIIGINIKAKIGTMAELPSQDHPNADQFVKDKLPQKPGLVAKGIAPLNSITGNIAISIVAKITLSLNSVANKLCKNSVTSIRVKQS